MSSRRTIWPLKVKKVIVSSTIRPVTQVAEVAVNSASIAFIPSPEVVISGIISRRVPTVVIPKKLRINMTAGCILTFGRTDPFLISSAITTMAK